MGRPSPSKGLFHLSNVNINLLICPGAIKHSSPKGKKKIPAVFSLYLPSLIVGLISKLSQPSGQESHAMAPANRASGPTPASALRVLTAAWTHQAKSTRASPAHGDGMTHCWRDIPGSHDPLLNHQVTLDTDRSRSAPRMIPPPLQEMNSSFGLSPVERWFMTLLP